MSNNVTVLLFVLFFAFIFLVIAVSWIRWAVENVQFVMSMYEAWKRAKQNWERQQTPQGSAPTAPSGERAAPGPGDGSGSTQP